jgi:hypothetical protein
LKLFKTDYEFDITGKIEKVSSNAKEIVSDADIILICSPAHTKNGLLA